MVPIQTLSNIALYFLLATINTVLAYAISEVTSRLLHYRRSVKKELHRKFSHNTFVDMRNTAAAVRLIIFYT